MRIISMKLENFQGIREFSFAPEGRSFSIYGENGTGKTTIYNAFCWLMYGRAGTGEKGYTPKTAGEHHLDHVAEMTAELDGQGRITLRKVYHEVYKTKRGSADPVFAGHTTDYFVDGVPVNETEYKKTVSGICGSEELAKMLTNIGYFLEEMGVKERRNVLLQICGDVPFAEVVAGDQELAELPDILRKPGGGDSLYTVDEWMAIANARKKAVNDELRGIPGRIDEAERAKPEAPVDSEEKLRKRLKAATSERDELSREAAAARGSAEASIRKEIAELKGRKAEKKAEFLSKQSELSGEVMSKVNALRATQVEAEEAVRRSNAETSSLLREAERMEKERERLLSEYREEFSRQWDGSDTCPTCGQKLPEEKLKESIDRFNIAKSEKLESIKTKGKTCGKDVIEKMRAEAARLSAKAAELGKKAEATRKEADEVKSSIAKPLPYEGTAECAEFEDLIRRAEAKLDDAEKAAEEAARDAESRLKAKNAEIQSIMDDIAAVTAFERQERRIKELGAREKELGAAYESLQKGIYLCELFGRCKAAMLDKRINEQFETLRFRLFQEQVNGGIAEDCEAMIPCDGRMVPFRSANNASRVNAGLEVIDVLSRHYGVSLPVFLDNAESVIHLRRAAAQTARLVVSEGDASLRFEIDEDVNK